MIDGNDGNLMCWDVKKVLVEGVGDLVSFPHPLHVIRGTRL